MIEAICISTEGPAVTAKAHNVADKIHFVWHREGSFANAVNQALSQATGPVLKIDDDDEYPFDHGKLVEQWEPGVLLYGVCNWYGCDGQFLRRAPSLCASVLDPSVRVTQDVRGQITGSVLAQSRVVEVETGVRKVICPGKWRWGLWPGMWEINCEIRQVG